MVRRRDGNAASVLLGNYYMSCRQNMLSYNKNRTTQVTSAYQWEDNYGGVSASVRGSDNSAPKQKRKTRTRRAELMVLFSFSEGRYFCTT